MLASTHQRGMTLVELMVGSAISLVTLSTVVTVYSATAQHASRQLQEADLQQQIHALANQLASDLRRSGYWWFDPILTPAPENPFEQPGNRLRIDAMDNQPAESCILYSYDLDADGLVGIGQCKNGKCGALTDEDNVEQFGFRFNNGRVQSRYGGRSLACNGGNWQTVTTANIVIDSLRFRLHSNCSNLTEREQACQADMPSLQQRALEFQIAGHVEGRDTIRLDLSRWIHIRNNQLLEPSP